MATTTHPENATDRPETITQVKTVQVQLGDRTYSPSWSFPAPPAVIGSRRLVERPDNSQLPGLLAETISNRLPWNSVRRDDTDRGHFADTYVRSLTQLDQFRRDVENLIRYACLANLEFRQASGQTNTNARDAALSAKLDDMLSQAADRWSPTKNVLDEKLTSQHVSTLRNHLEVALAEAVNVFVTQLLAMLARLVDRQLFGLVEWLPNHGCGYHFFKHLVVQENEGPAAEVVEEQFFDADTPRDPAGARESSADAR